MTFHLVRAWGHTCWSCPGSERVCSIKGTWQWPLHITRTQSSRNIQIHMKSVHTQHVLDNHFLRVPNKCAYVCILELNHLVYPPPLLPTTPPRNVFHAYEKNVRWHKQTREDLTLLKLLLLPISSFPPASAEETEKERQTEKERACLYTVGIWNISLWTVLIIAGYSPSTPRHLTLSQSETSAALCGSSGLGVELWGAVVSSSWKKKSLWCSLCSNCPGQSRLPCGQPKHFLG